MKSVAKTAVINRFLLELMGILGYFLRTGILLSGMSSWRMGLHPRSLRKHLLSGESHSHNTNL